jgi:hypothetical protein
VTQTKFCRKCRVAKFRNHPTANPAHTHVALWLPRSGLSEVIGMVLDTMFKNTVNESSMVTPESNRSHPLLKCMCVVYICTWVPTFERVLLYAVCRLFSNMRTAAQPYRPCIFNHSEPEWDTLLFWVSHGCNDSATTLAALAQPGPNVQHLLVQIYKIALKHSLLCFSLKLHQLQS